MTTLPIPSDDAIETSQRLISRIKAEIELGGGWIPFSRYMELALYTPTMGYYSAGSRKFGPSGDFVTAPELTPLFAATLARQIAEILPHTAGDILEFGAGTGRLACDILLALKEQGQLPRRYCILEVSGDLADRQKALLAQYAPDLLPRISWLTALPAQFDGVMIGNEVLDAIPCETVRWDDTLKPWMRGVMWTGEGFDWVDRPISAMQILRASGRIEPGPDYISEINLAAEAFIQSAANSLSRGALILLDYGFPRDEYYHPQRKRGTLMCHYRHHSHDDPFLWPGLQDITAHVDFTAMAEAGLEAGLDLIGYTTQAQFLLNCGITDELAKLDPEQVETYLPASAAVQKLVSTAEMGDLFKVIAFGREVPIEWKGFAQGDRCCTL